MSAQVFYVFNGSCNCILASGTGNQLRNQSCTITFHLNRTIIVRKDCNCILLLVLVSFTGLFHTCHTKNNFISEMPCSPPQKQQFRSHLFIALLLNSQEEERDTHKRYWEVNRELKKKKITPCLICYFHRDGKVVPVKNKDREVAFCLD